MISIKDLESCASDGDDFWMGSNGGDMLRASWQGSWAAMHLKINQALHDECRGQLQDARVLLHKHQCGCPALDLQEALQSGELM